MCHCATGWITAGRETGCVRRHWWMHTQINANVQNSFKGGTTMSLCPCLSLFLGLQCLLFLLSSHSPPLLPSSSVTSTRIWDSRGSEPHKLQFPTPALSTTLSPWWLMPGCPWLLAVLPSLALYPDWTHIQCYQCRATRSWMTACVWYRSHRRKFTWIKNVRTQNKVC